MKIIVVVLILIFLYILFRISMRRNPASGSGGLSPSGGMRNNVMEQVALSDKNVEYPTYDVYIYDNSGIPERMTWDIGHWSSL